MANYTMRLDFLAAVPVGNQVRIDYFDQEVGARRDAVALDRASPTITDLDTKIGWAPRKHFDPVRPLADHLDRRLRTSYSGRVLSCTVATRSGERATIETERVTDPMEPPGARGPYRSERR